MLLCSWGYLFKETPMPKPIHMIHVFWLVVEPTPPEKYESVGMMTFPTEWKNNPNVPNHQPE